MTTPVGPTNQRATLVDLSDAANIQVALTYAIFGNDNGNSVSPDSVYASVPTKVQSATADSTTFSGTVVLPSTTSIAKSDNSGILVSAEELSYLDGATSNIQTQIDSLAKLDSFWFGDGSDGNVTVSSGTTDLSRDMYYDTLTISGTGSINPKGFRIFVKTTLDLSNAPAGAIKNTANNGGNASLNGRGAGGAGSTLTTSYYGRSTSGSDGRDGSAVGTTSGNLASAVTADSPIFFNNWISARGGISVGVGGGGSTQTLRSASSTALTWRRSFVDISAPFISGTIYCGAGGNGGNGGGSVETFPGGGGGGGGAGNIGCFIYAKNIKVGASTVDSAISFVGGTGGNGDNGDADGQSTTGGGGAGGQGGIVYLVYKTKEGTMATDRYLVNTSGGNGGTGYRGGQGGASGSIAMTNLTSGTMTVYAATAGATSSSSTGGVGNSNKRNLV